MKSSTFSLAGRPNTGPRHARCQPSVSLLQSAVLRGTTLLSAGSIAWRLLWVVRFADRRTIVPANRCLRKSLHSVQSRRHLHTNRCQTRSVLGERFRCGRWQFFACGRHISSHSRNVHQCTVNGPETAGATNSGGHYAGTGARVPVRKASVANRKLVHTGC